jgi:hypothetical protein
MCNNVKHTEMWGDADGVKVCWLCGEVVTLYCPKCNSQVYEPPTHDKNGEPVGGGVGYVYHCRHCDKLWFRDECNDIPFAELPQADAPKDYVIGEGGLG